MKNSRIRRWINEHAHLLRTFDFDRDETISELEATSLYALLAEFIRLYEANSLWYYRDEKSETGPVQLSEVPDQSSYEVRPAGNETWLAASLLFAVIRELKPQRKVRTSDDHPASIGQDRRIQRGPAQIQLSTTDQITGYTIDRHLGLVWGISARSRNLVTVIFAAINSLFGGEISAYTQLAIDARQAALDRMLASAARKNADAVIRIQFDSSAAAPGATEVVAYGTAVKLRPIQ